MPGRHFLHIPGPTNVPDRILNAMHVPMQDHRSPAFPQLVLPLLADLKRVFQTTNGQAFIFPATGTGAWEAVLVNTLCSGDRVLAPRYGQFSHLWAEMALRHGLDVQVQDEAWGTGADPEHIHAALQQDRSHAIRAVLVVHNETATGVTSDIAAIRRAIDAAQHPALLFVDGVSSIGCIDFRMDEWGVDGAVAGSQKGFMMPAGLGFPCFSQKALEAARSARKNNPLHRSYFDIAAMQRSNKDGYFPYTPSLPLLYGLRESLRMLFEEGLASVFARHAHLSGGVRAAVEQGWRLPLCARAPHWHSNTVSAVLVPDGIDAAAVIARAFSRYNLSLGSGLSQVAGKLFRIGHLGDLNELMCLGAITGAEMAMQDCGIAVEPGSGAAAAQAFYRAHGDALAGGQ
jgi:alanine-glyoxylate transaminase / serine-glyoxylate transaminase / serine-pyruvate transaminase